MFCRYTNYIFCRRNFISINLNVARLNGKIFSRTLAHEAGHSLYNKENSKSNKKLLDTFAKEYGLWLTHCPDMYKQGDVAYCTEDVYEFVAEAYCLLSTGNAKSAYTICSYFPETLKLVKEMMND